MIVSLSHVSQNFLRGRAFSDCNVTTSCGHVDVVRGVGRPESVLVKVVVGEVLPVVVGGHVVDVDLVALLQVVEEESVVGHVEDQLLHLLRQTVQVVAVLAVPRDVDVFQYSLFNLIGLYRSINCTNSTKMQKIFDKSSTEICSLRCERSGEEGVKQDDGLVEVPYEDSLYVWVLRIGALTAPPFPAASTRTLPH